MIRIAIVLLGALVALSARAAPPQGIDETATLEAGDAGRRIVTLARAYESVGFTGAVLAARRGEVVAAVGVGSSDLEGKRPNTPATLFEIASATKQFTAAAAVRLAQDGKLDLDAPIARYLAGVPKECEPITTRHLLQHTSGMPGTNTEGGGEDIGVALPMFLKGGPRYEPGSHWEYWNQGYAITSEIIAKGSGEAFTAYCRRALFEPAGMKATCFTGDKPPAAPGATPAVGRSGQGPARGALEHPYGSYGLQYRGMGGAVTNVWDLWRWDRALGTPGKVLGEKGTSALFTPGLNSYALGWFVRTDAKGRRVQSHGGGVRGFVCEVRRLPDDDGCVIVLCNDDRAPARLVADAVQAALLGDPAGAMPPAPLPDALGLELAGQFKDEKGNTLRASREGKVVRAEIEWAGQPGLKTHGFLGAGDRGDITFFDGNESITATIVRDAKGALTGVTIQDQRFVRAP